MTPGANLGNITVQPVTAAAPVSAVIAVADTRLQGLNRLDQFAIGQQIQAKVVSLFQDGSALVRMGETAARMTLPSNARAGSTVLLTLTSKDPRPTFSMQLESSSSEEDTRTNSNIPTGRTPLGYNAAGNSTTATLADTELGITGAGVRGSGVAAAGNVAAAPGTAPNAAGLPESANITLSAAGRIINNLLQAQPASISGATLLPGPPTMPTQHIAGALQNSVAFSGVFYESHVTEWAAGKRDLADLQREPQAQTGKTAGAAPADPALLNRPDAADTDIGKIVNMQLNTLDQHKIHWQGEVWPGQQMEWEIARNNDGDSGDQSPQADGAEAPPSWQSVVRFNFEHLGTVAASIRLVGDRIHMQIRTGSDDATAALRSHGNELTESLAAAGSSLDSLIVKRDGPA
ncbi:MAG: flagellar hook-length control protein FliK [Herbaspirillum sp.]|jgi:hypothetical protein|nr:flagellar hook-length control protein FliK [Herbaspirillum sp.]